MERILKWLFSRRKESYRRTANGSDYEGQDIYGSELKNAIIQNSKFWKTKFVKADVRDSDLSGSDFMSAIFERADFRGTTLNRVKHFDTIAGLDTARFNDSTKIEGVDLELIAKHEPVVARRLRSIRYVGKIKRSNPWVYWPWWLICDCGRSSGQLLLSVVIVTVVFAVTFFLGAPLSHSPFLPHIINSNGAESTIFQCFQFSALTLAGFNMPEITWYNTRTGAWVVAEVWAGLILLGGLVSVIVTSITKNE